MENNMTITEMAELVSGEICSFVSGIDPDSFSLSDVNTLDEACENELSFLSNAKYLKDAQGTKAVVILIAEDIFKRISQDEKEKSGKVYVVVKNPQYAMSKLLEKKDPTAHFRGISDKASISKNVNIEDGVSIGDFCVVEDGASIGSGSVIYPGCYIGSGASVGKDCLVHPNVVVGERVKVGSRVIIHNGVTIGSDGFGFAFDKGVHKKIPQVGTVRVDDDVEIGANTAIDRGTIGATIIGAGTKIDNLVHIAHNVRIGKNCLIIAQVGISGSTRIGDYVTIAGQAGIAGHLSIGDRAVVAGRGGVIGDVPAGSVVSGFPARPHKEAMRIIAATHRLPKILKQLKRGSGD